MLYKKFIKNMAQEKEAEDKQKKQVEMIKTNNDPKKRFFDKTIMRIGLKNKCNLARQNCFFPKYPKMSWS